MKKAEKAERIRVQLAALYPLPPIPLAHSDPFTLLVAVMLSAQTTDARVNLVTPALFARAHELEFAADVLVRIQHNRSLGRDGRRLFKELSQASELGEVGFELPRGRGRKARPVAARSPCHAGRCDSRPRPAPRRTWARSPG